MAEQLQIIDKQPTDRELILCITAACELPSGFAKMDLLRELTTLLARLNNPVRMVVSGELGARHG